MKIASLEFPIFNPYNKSTIEIYFQGCLRDTCTPGACHNPELRDICSGQDWSVDEILEYIEQRDKFIQCISLIGGEPLHQNQDEMEKLVRNLKFKYAEKDLWLFTGADDFAEIPQFYKDFCNVIKYGSFQKSLQQDGFPSSSNQQIWRNGI